ncbi:hypothetical protein Tco_1022231 [Tanacetum coccineum]
MKTSKIPELLHVTSGASGIDEKCRITWSECNSIQNDLKCGFSWCQSTRDSSIAFSDIKSILFGTRLQVKLGLLSSDGSHDSAKIVTYNFHIQANFIQKTQTF